MALLVLMLSGCASKPVDWHDDDSYGGWVTDAATGEAIEGAVVLIKWLIVQPTLNMHGGETQRIARLEETLTDKDGRFDFAPLGDYSPPPTWFRADTAYPILMFFKPGYEPTYRQRFTWEFGDQQLERNPRGIPLRKEAWKREIQLYPYMTGPLTGPRPDDPIFRNLTEEQKILNFLTGFAASLERNVDISASDLSPFRTTQRRKTVEAEWRAIVMVDSEIRKYRPQYTWRTSEIKEALGAAQPAQRPPKTAIQPTKKQPAFPDPTLPSAR